jgi:tetratricopeptide (TPR) repeat protein
LQQDHQQLGALYLAGDALIRGGQEDRGKELQQQADRLAVQSSMRHSLALDLYSRGLRAEAMERWKLLLRLAPFENWYVNDAARRIADYTMNRDPGRTADLWQRYVFGDFRVAFRFSEDKSYLRLPFLIHKMRARAAIEAKDWEAVAEHTHSAAQAMPGETTLAEELVPLLDVLERTDEADRLADEIVEHFRAGTEQHPDSAFFHNNLAWAAARCHRQLDLAMQHANKAVELEPKNGSYVDTLAEVHFHLGDREKAIEVSERAVQLRPTASLREQLERFRNDPLPN